MSSSKPPERLIWVSLPHATFGLVVRGGKVVGFPPIAARTVRGLGGDERAVARYYRGRGAVFRDATALASHSPHSGLPAGP